MKRRSDEKTQRILAAEAIKNDPNLTVEEQVKFLCALLRKGGRNGRV